MSRSRQTRRQGSPQRRAGVDSRDHTIQLRQAIRCYLPSRGLPLISAGGRWSDRLLVMTVVLMVFSALGTLQERFAAGRATVVQMYRSRKRPGKTYAGFIGQLVVRSAALLEVVVPLLRQRVEALAGDSWRVGRHLAFAVDGTKSDAPRTKANRQGLKIGGKHKSGPQQLLVPLWHVGTGLPWSWRRGVATASERGLLVEQLGLLPPGALLLGDAGFVGMELFQTIQASGQHLLVRAGANVTLLRGLGWEVEERGDLVYLWPQQARQAGEAPLVLRRIVLVDGRNRRMCLLTDLSAAELTVEEAQELYHRRWGIEVFFRGLKQTLGRRKMLSDSPTHAAVELDWTMVGYWMLGLLRWENRPAEVPVSQGLAWALRLVRAAVAGRGDKRGSLAAAWGKITADRYRRRRPKKAWRWPHKKNDPPCGTPHVRMATPLEIRSAKRLAARKQAA